MAASLRPLSCELSTLNGADGSALLKSGGTHVLAAVQGPLSPRQSHQEHPFRCGLTVLLEDSRDWEAFLHRMLSTAVVLEAYPYSHIAVTVQVLSRDGSVLACVWNAIVLALMDAGIELWSLPAAVTCNAVDGGEVVIDPSESDSGSIVLIVDDKDCVVGTQTIGTTNQSTETFLNCCSTAVKAASVIRAFDRVVFESKADRESKTLWSRLR